MDAQQVDRAEPAGLDAASVQNLACPRCGGALLNVQGKRVLRCRYCATRSYIDGVQFIPEYRLPHISKAEAAIAARAFLKDRRVAKDMPARAKPHDMKLVLLPFYEIYARKVGLMERREKVYRKDLGKEITEVDSRVLLSDFLRHAPASRTWIGYESINIEKVRQCKEPIEISPLADPKRSEEGEQVFEPTVPVQEQRERLAKAPVLKDVKFDFELKDERINLIYYPIWIVKVSYRKGLYTLVIDGVNAGMLSARLPADDSKRAAGFIAMALLTGLPLGKLCTTAGIETVKVTAAFVMFFPFVGIPLLALAGFGLAAGVSACWNRLRYPTELIVQGDRSRIEMVGKTGETLPEKLVRILGAALSKMSHKPTSLEG